MSLTVSVIIPTFNRAPFLSDAIESVRRQSYAPLEILVIDDGSTDDTPEVVRGYGEPVRYFSQDNRGPSAARNLGIANAGGDLISFLDDDDVWLPQALEWSVARFMDRAAPQADAVCGLTLRVKNLERTPDGFTYDPLLPIWATLSFCSACCRKELFSTVGAIDEQLRYGEDVDWFMRARELGVRFAFLNQPTHLYRMHENNVTKDRSKTNHFFLAALQRSLARRAQGDARTVTPLPDVADLHALNRHLHQNTER